MKNEKAKAAPAIVWEKGGLALRIGGKYWRVKHYSSSRSAKRGAERFAKRMQEILA